MPGLMPRRQRLTCWIRGGRLLVTSRPRRSWVVGSASNVLGRTTPIGPSASRRTVASRDRRTSSCRHGFSRRVSAKATAVRAGEANPTSRRANQGLPSPKAKRRLRPKMTPMPPPLRKRAEREAKTGRRATAGVGPPGAGPPLPGFGLKKVAALFCGSRIAQVCGKRRAGKREVESRHRQAGTGN